MTYDTTLLNYFYNASLVVKFVMLLLVSASVFSWASILQRLFYLREVKGATNKFENAFFEQQDLVRLYSQSQPEKKSLTGLEAIFYAGFKEFIRFNKQTTAAIQTILDNTKRAMVAAQIREQEKLENSLSFLAIVGSTSPYIGLFGTVWGIMQAFHALANVQQASISLVAPGIAEALIATALGLFAAIPAVIAYNRFTSEINRLMNRFDAFQEELVNSLIRKCEVKAINE